MYVWCFNELRSCFGFEHKMTIHMKLVCWWSANQRWVFFFFEKINNISKYKFTKRERRRRKNKYCSQLFFLLYSQFISYFSHFVFSLSRQFTQNDFHLNVAVVVVSISNDTALIKQINEISPASRVHSNNRILFAETSAIFSIAFSQWNSTFNSARFWTLL